MNWLLWVAVSSSAFAGVWWVIGVNINFLIPYSKKRDTVIHIFTALFWAQVLHTLGWLALGAFIAAVNMS